MKYRVVVAARAKDDLRQAYMRASGQAPQAAERWLHRLESALATLRHQPQRCPLAPENEVVPAEIRQLMFGRGRSIYRALFTIREDEVRVLHIRWGGRAFSDPDDLAD